MPQSQREGSCNLDNDAVISWLLLQHCLCANVLRCMELLKKKIDIYFFFKKGEDGCRCVKSSKARSLKRRYIFFFFFFPSFNLKRVQEKEKKKKNVRDLSSEVRCKRFGTRNKSRVLRAFLRQETACSSSAIPTRSLIRYSFSTIQNKLLSSCLARILVWVKEEYFLRRHVIIYFLIWLKLAIIKHPIIFALKLGWFFWGGGGGFHRFSRNAFRQSANRPPPFNGSLFFIFNLQPFARIIAVFKKPLHELFSC